MRIARLLPAFLALSSFGCLVGPNYHRPAVDMPSDWDGTSAFDALPTTQASQAKAVATDVARWWETFDDPVLDSLIARASQSNLDLQRAAARVRQARAQRGVSASGLLPTLDLNGRYSRSGTGPGDNNRDSGTVITLPDGTPITSGGNGSRGEVRRDLYRAGLDAAWEIDVFGGVRRDIEASDANIQFAVEDWRDVLVTLVSEVALNYVDLRQFQRQIDIAERNLSAQERTADVTHKRLIGGEASALDVANSEAQVAATRSQIPSLKAAERQAIYNLAVLLGRPPEALVGELANYAPMPQAPAEVPVGLPSELLMRRPDVRRAEAAAHVATARIGVATADLFPKFNLTGSLGLQGNRIGSLGDSRNYFWSFGPSVSWPLLDAGRIRSNIAVQEASQEEALLAYRAAILVALQDVENALVAFSTEQERRESLVQAVEQNRKAVDLSLKLYTEGNIEFLNVLQAQRSLFLSEDALVQSDRTVVTNLIAIYKALGGGWEPPATETR